MYNQNYYNILQQPVRHVKTKVELLGPDFFTLVSLEGIALEGKVTIDSASTYRRTGSFKLLIYDKLLLPNPESPIWFNNRIRVWIGLEDFVNVETLWYNLGVFAFDKMNLDLSDSTATIACELKDNMAFLDGTLGGRWTAQTQILAQGVTIREAVRAILGPGHKVSLDPIVISGVEAVLPFAITQQPNSTKYDFIKNLVGLYKGYEFFYDENGYFIMRKMLNFKNDAVIWDFDDSNMNLAIGHSRRFSFSDINNSIHIIGRQLDNGLLVRFSYRNRFARAAAIALSELPNLLVGDICYISNENKSYVWMGSVTGWQLLDFNVTPMFNIENIGEKTYVISDSNIQTEGVARLRAEFELWQKTNFAEQIDFSCVPIYVLDVGRKIKVAVPEIGISGEYIIDNIAIPLSFDGTMDVQATKIYY